MAQTSDRQIEHLLRRAGFGARPDELATYRSMSVAQAADTLVNYDILVPDDVDSFIGKPGYVNTTLRGVFSPQTVIVDARQRWLFRMVHSNRPLQEKMTLFWHNHFATGYTKIAGALNTPKARGISRRRPLRIPAWCAGRSRCCATTPSATSATSS